MFQGNYDLKNVYVETTSFGYHDTIQRTMLKIWTSK